MGTDLIVPKTDAIDLASIEVELKSRTDAELKRRFFECYHGAAVMIAEAAVCLKMLKDRDPDNIRGIPMAGTFLRIASGQILPEMVWEFIESPNRHLVERMPLDDQRRVTADPMVPVVVARDDHGYTKGHTTRMVDLRTAPREIARQAIGPAGIRSPEEQIAVLCAPKARPVLSPTTPDEPDPEPTDQRLAIKLTASEVQSLRLHAALAGVTDSEMARRLLRQAGAFKRPKT